mmetsp:Transcript_2800/g.5878  ORF Transcript_2800/g.5878 Transcript_2800/m.5878 type:complete len:214 (-) Transcript_2800:1743-2384(-)
MCTSANSSSSSSSLVRFRFLRGTRNSITASRNSKTSTSSRRRGSRGDSSNSNSSCGTAVRTFVPLASLGRLRRPIWFGCRCRSDGDNSDDLSRLLFRWRCCLLFLFLFRRLAVTARRIAGTSATQLGRRRRRYDTTFFHAPALSVLFRRRWRVCRQRVSTSAFFASLLLLLLTVLLVLIAVAVTAVTLTAAAAAAAVHGLSEFGIQIFKQVVQ